MAKLTAKQEEQKLALGDWWDDKVYSTILNDVVTVEEEKAAIEKQKIKDEAFRIAIEAAQKEVELKKQKEFDSRDMVLEFNYVIKDNFHLDLIEYKKTKDQIIFEKIWPELQKIMKNASYKHIIKLPTAAKQIKYGEVQDIDYTEFLTEKLLEAIDAWQPDYNGYHIKFSVFFDKVVYNYIGNMYNLMQNEYYKQGMEFRSLDSEKETKKLLDKITKNHYQYNDNGQMFMNAYVELFLKFLRKKDKELPMLLGLLISERYTRSEIAKYLGCSTKTIQRKTEQIRKEWIKYTEEQPTS